ncbi:MAG: proteasome accessory factor PafA2 family protein [Pirellulales bacterium]|nr:proteasome accessory factor PafA2 family protein [Pirellulales bacterium]
MPKPNSQFVMSTELECLTSIRKGDSSVREWASRFFDVMATLAPALPAVSGIFNGYGRVYIDCGHMELALAECESPYLLARIVERQQSLVRQAVVKLQEEGIQLLLASNNHSGLLQAHCPIWGSHENHMTERHPSEFGEMILPFLTTRIYAGAGGIVYPSGQFLAAVRPIRMEMATGGGTTECRAIHSTAREEHHMGPDPQFYRYHQILGDGHRSQFNLALQFGATALALKAIFFDRKLRRALKQIAAFPPKDSWVALLRRLNVLASDGGPLCIDPLIPKTQQIYLDAAHRYANSLREVPDWIPGILRDWEQTLIALKQMNRPWLAARLDAFAKYEFYSAVLREMNLTWESLPDHPPAFNELALLDHSYHAFCSSQSVFNRLEKAGMLQHRIGPQINPGQEPEPYVPETQTRARARARFIRDHASRRSFVVDWSWIHDMENNRRQTIFNPFGEKYDDWKETPNDLIYLWPHHVYRIRSGGSP